MNSSKHRFKRQESWRLKRVSEAWRRPRGVTSRMRKEKAGWPPRVKNGYGSAVATRGLHPRKLIEKRLERLSDLEGLDPKRHIIRLSARLGEKKRLLLLERVRQLNFHIANPGKQEARPAGGEEETGPEKALGQVEPTIAETPETRVETAKEAPGEVVGEVVAESELAPENNDEESEN